MKRTLIASLLAAALVAPNAPALAGGYGHKGHHYHGGHHYKGGHKHYRHRHHHHRRHGHSHGDALLIGAGIVGGAILLGTLLSQPRYYHPPPSYSRTCYKDEVWRRLPDGRVQTGVRTRCY